MEIYGLYTVHKNEKNADGFSYPVHSHSSHEILIVTKGNCGIVIGDTEYELGKNDAALMFGNEEHGLLIHEAPFEFFAVQFIPRVCEEVALDPMLSSLSAFCGGKSGSALTLNDSVFPAVAACMRRMCDERSDTNTEMYFTYIKSVLYELLHNSTPKAGVAVRRKSATAANTELMNAVTDYIGANLNSIKDLSFIENEFHYSNSHVNRLFRSALGISVWRYITVKRLDMAYNLIADGTDAKRAAEYSGYNDYSVFYKSFVRHFGTSPSMVKKGKRSGTA